MLVQHSALCAACMPPCLHQQEELMMCTSRVQKEKLPVVVTLQVEVRALLLDCKSAKHDADIETHQLQSAKRKHAEEIAE